MLYASDPWCFIAIHVHIHTHTLPREHFLLEFCLSFADSINICFEYNLGFGTAVPDAAPWTTGWPQQNLAHVYPHIEEPGGKRPDLDVALERGNSLLGIKTHLDSPFFLRQLQKPDTCPRFLVFPEIPKTHWCYGIISIDVLPPFALIIHSKFFF